VATWFPTGDADLDRVAIALYRLDPAGDRTARVIRNTLDQLLDGIHTGRWDWKHLRKTEKTHMGTLVEINMQRAFEFDDGDETDYRIAGVQVDCKFSQDEWGWMLPPEVFGELALVIWANDYRSLWRAGLLRVDELHLRGGQNRDAKRSLLAEFRSDVHFLWAEESRDRPLPSNLLLHLDSERRDAIVNAKSRSGRHGQARVNELFRRVQGVLVDRTTIETLARQDDPMKRARGSGGARTYLQPEGIVVLGHQQNDPLVADALGIPKPVKGQFIAARVVPVDAADTRQKAEINEQFWAVACDDDPVVPAPVIPR
jgi:hypothetical protein